MHAQDREAIDALFAKLADVARRSDPRDPEAEALIRQRMGELPAAPYFMAQTLVMQQYALDQAQARIAELERAAAAPRRGGFFGFGARPEPQRPPAAQPMAAPAFAPPGQAAPPGQPARGGFLAGAAQTAMGVAGGVLLGNMIGNMFSGGAGGAAQAAQPAQPAPEPAPAGAGAGEDQGMFGSMFGGSDEEI
jgi:hypothetical protein